jgi:hypothetical protein
MGCVAPGKKDRRSFQQGKCAQIVSQDKQFFLCCPAHICPGPSSFYVPLYTVPTFVHRSNLCTPFQPLYTVPTFVHRSNLSKEPHCGLFTKTLKVLSLNVDQDVAGTDDRCGFPTLSDKFQNITFKHTAAFAFQILNIQHT